MSTYYHYRESRSAGYLVVLTLVFGAVFLVMLVALIGFVVGQAARNDDRLVQEEALAVAESGLNYYKWFLAHNPGDLTNGTGEEGPYQVPYRDPEGGVVGTSTLSVSGNTVCGVVQSIDIESTGVSTRAPQYAEIVRARYARPTVASYAYIINTNVWAGDDRTIIGPYHANGIIRMDGTNNSIVTSGQESWECDGSMPCDPNNLGSTLPAIYGDGVNDHLWLYPQPPISFAGITVDLSFIQDVAENDEGIYLPPSGEYGYRIRFNGDGTVSAYSVDQIYNTYEYDSAGGWTYRQNTIRDDDFVATYTIDAACPAIFVEDKVWLEGTFTKRVTLAAADIDTTGVDPSIIINGELSAGNKDAGLLAIAENDVLIGLVVPNNLEVEGIFVAQNGRFGRNHFRWWYLPYWMRTYIERDTLTIHGSIVSNQRVGTKWVNQWGNHISGFETRVNSYDRDLVTDPPPFTPEISDTYEFIEWRHD